MLNPGGGVEYDMTQQIATRTRDAFYLRKLITERSVGTGGLLPESISEITVIVFYFCWFSPFLVLLLCFLWKYWIFTLNLSHEDN